MNPKLAKEYEIKRKSLVQTRDSTVSGFRFGNKAIAAKYPGGVEEIRAFFNKSLEDLAKEYETRERALEVDHSTVIKSSSAVEEAPVVTDSRMLDLTVDDKKVIYYKPVGQTAELRNWQQRAANAIYEKLFTTN